MTRVIYYDSNAKAMMVDVDQSKHPIVVPQEVMDAGADALDRFVDTELAKRAADRTLGEGRHDAWRK